MKTLIIGAGQIGGSIALAANSHQIKNPVALYDNDPTAADILIGRCPSPASILEKTNDLPAAAAQANIIILATAIDRFPSIMATIAPHIKPGTIITDVGSVKTCVVKAITEHLPRFAHLVPAHPTIGKSGHGAASADEHLFDGKKIIVVPGHAPETQVRLVEKFWESIGGVPTRMNEKTHDKIYGTISHLVHAIAFSVMATGRDNLKTTPAVCDVFKLHAGNFLRDSTRFTNTSADMWVPIFTHNRDFILESARSFKSTLQHLHHAALNDNTALKSRIQSAHDYVAPMHLRQRETLAADLKDAGFVSGKFNMCTQKIIGKSITFPALLAAALSLHTQTLERELNFKMGTVVNPSFKDSTRAMAHPADVMAAHLRVYRETITPNLERFLRAFDDTIDAIEKGDKGFLTALINSAKIMRLQMPPVRKPAGEITNGELPLRPEYSAA